MGTRRRPWSAVRRATLRWRDPAEAIDLGDELRAAGDVAGARAASQQAIDSGHPDIAPAGAWWMGTLLRDADEPEQAAACYGRAIASGHEVWSLRAAIDLGDLLRARGDASGAAAHYRSALDSADPAGTAGPGVWAHRAAVRLAVLLTAQGDTAGAGEVEQLATGGDPRLRVRFAVDRAEELRRRGDVDAAITSYREAIDRAGPAAARVNLQLGRLLRDHGDLDGARAALRAAADSGDPPVAQQAAALLHRL